MATWRVVAQLINSGSIVVAITVMHGLTGYYVGSTIGALLMAAAAYFVALAFVTSRRRITDMIHHHQHHHKH